MEKINILIVEDERIVAKDIEGRLNSLGYGVSGTASSGKQALKKIEELRPDIILMDVKIKGDIDGIETARQVRNLYDIPVLFLTAYADEKTLERAKLTEPFAYILKPFHARELYSAIEVSLYKHKMEKELREREQWLATTLRSIADGVITTDKYRNITFMNPTAERLTGCQYADALGKEFQQVFNVVDGENRPLNENTVEKVIGEGRTLDFVNYFVINGTNNTQTAIEKSVSPVKDEKGNPIGAILVFRDVSERKIMEEQLRHSQEMKILGQIAAGVAHEVRNPLHAILAITEALFQDIGDNIEYQPYLEHIRNQVDRLSRLMTDLLGLGRHIHSSNLRHEALVGICRSAIELWQQTDLSKTHSINFKAFAENETFFVVIDDSRLQQVFLNLLENAAQNSPDASEIEFSIAEPEENRIRVLVTDRGSGVADENLSKVFEPFFTTRRKGVGLGLNIAKHFVESMNGKITIRNNDPPPGCTAEVSLPIYRDHAL